MTTAAMQSKQIITLDATSYRGVPLDKMVEIGPRGGQRVWWRASVARGYLIASWSPTRDQAARTAPGYTG